MTSLVNHERQSVILWLRLLICGVVCMFFATCSLMEWRRTASHPFRDLPLEGCWIRAAGEPSRAGYFRKRFDVAGDVKHAWIVIAANGGCEVSVNRNPMGRIYLWRPTRAFQSGSSERGQMLHPHDPTMALNFPREYQWSGHENTLLPLYLDLTPSFRAGINEVCVEIESRSVPAVASFHGRIELWSGETIPIRSDESWLGEPTPLGPQTLDWTEPLYWDKEWRQAAMSNVHGGHSERIVPEAIYAQPFHGLWQRHPSANTESSVCFRKSLQIRHEVDEAWLRLITNRPFDIRINNQRVIVPVAHPSDQDTGEWILGKSAAIDPITNPELLDPDEVGSFFVGDAFESPRKADASLEEFIPVQPMHNMPFQYKRTTNRSEPAGIYDPERTLAESRRTPSGPDHQPELPIPNALKRDLSSGGYFAYSIAPLLQPGINTIEIRCLSKEHSAWPPQIAVDGGFTTAHDQGVHSLADGSWQATMLASGPDDQTNSPQEWTEALCEGPAAEAGYRLPALKYRGIVRADTDRGDVVNATVQVAMATGGGFAICFLLTLMVYRNLRRAMQTTVDTAFAMYLIGAVAFASAFLVFVSWQERSESIWFDRGIAWQMAFWIASCASLLVSIIPLWNRLHVARSKIRSRGLAKLILELPESRLWPLLLVWVALLCLFLRAYKLDLQPLDDDEYASTQAVLSILETGVPGFAADGVYYTRSPLFHYMTAAIAYPFGGNLWSLRLQSVAWSVATVLLTYLVGARLVGSRWVGLGAMLLLTLHPLEVFTGHVIRFYQMQQFLTLWTIYLFCQGFVTKQTQPYRIGAVLVFAAAVLSQEITAAMAVPMVIAYLLFAKDLGWRSNIQLAAVAGMAGACIAIDLLAFQSLCLTRTEGVSPSIEATMKPHFWQPYNLVSVFIGYSRLHIVLSAFLLVGIPVLWKEQNRNTLALFTFLLSGVLMTNLLVTNVSLRYQYWLFPIWLLLCVESIRLLLRSAARCALTGGANPMQYTSTVVVSSAIVVAGCIASFSPWRLLDSYELSILGDSTGCVRYVHSQFRPGDRVAISEPHTHAGLIENGQIDYDVSIPLLYDFAVMQDGRLIDRNGGARIVSNLDSLKHEFAKDGRVWVIINREKFRARGKNLRWEYPGARFEMFLRKNCELKYRTYLWSAYLWEPARGHYAHFQSQE